MLPPPPPPPPPLPSHFASFATNPPAPASGSASASGPASGPAPGPAPGPASGPAPTPPPSSPHSPPPPDPIPVLNPDQLAAAYATLPPIHPPAVSIKFLYIIYINMLITTLLASFSCTPTISSHLAGS